MGDPQRERRKPLERDFERIGTVRKGKREERREKRGKIEKGAASNVNREPLFSLHFSFFTFHFFRFSLFPLSSFLIFLKEHLMKKFFGFGRAKTLAALAGGVFYIRKGDKV
jgi:hypothetical protein